MLLSGCVGGQAKKVASQQTAPLPIIDLRATVTVLDAETGEPIPDAWVLIVARVTTDRPAPSGHLEAAAGARGVTGPQGTASIQRVEGTYYPGEPKGKAWHVMELSRTERLGPMKLTGIQGGSLVIASAKYGFVHQPFVVEDDPSYQNWLQKNRREDYNGWLGRDTMRKQLPLLSVRTKDIKEGVPLTIKMRRPASLDEWANMISPVIFWNSTWVGMGKDAGAGEDEQRRIYWLFARQLDQIGLMSGKMEHVESFAVYLREEAIKLYLNHGLKNPDQQGAIQLWLARKALEVLPPDAAEVKEYAQSILKGVEEEGRDPRRQYHYQSPNDPSVGLPGFDSALRWSGLDQDNAKNEWDWQDAQRYYREGEKARAYQALGHVLRLLVNLAIPKYAQMQEIRDSEFESAVEALMKDQAGQLPPEYWWQTKEPAPAKTPRARFDALTGRTGALGLEAGLSGQTAMNGTTSAPGIRAAREGFPQAIAQAAGLLRDFHRLTHPPSFVAAPGDGNGGEGGPSPLPAISTSTISPAEVPWNEIADAISVLPTAPKGLHKIGYWVPEKELKESKGRIERLKEKGDIIPGVARTLERLKPGSDDAERTIFNLVTVLRENPDERALTVLDRLAKTSPAIKFRSPSLDGMEQPVYGFQEIAREAAWEIRVQAGQRKFRASMRNLTEEQRAVRLGEIVWRIQQSGDEHERLGAARLFEQIPATTWWPLLKTRLPKNLRNPREHDREILRAMLYWVRVAFEDGLDQEYIKVLVEEAGESSEEGIQHWAREIRRSRKWKS